MRLLSAGFALLAALAVAACGGSGTTITNDSGSGGAAVGGHTATVTRTVGSGASASVSPAGGALPTTPIHATEDFFGRTRLRELTVAPGQTVSFRLDVTHDGPDCATADDLQVIAPNDTVTLRTALPGGVAECDRATVSPVQP